MIVAEVKSFNVATTTATAISVELLRAMRKEELMRCQIQEWYPNFRSYSIKTLILPIPPPFLEYLLQDDGPFLLPTPVSGSDPLPRTTTAEDPDHVSFFPSDDDSDEDGENAAPSFPEFETEVERSIAALGGQVFPKLNWSSPKDSASMGVAGSLKSTSFAEIALLLKSSDCVSHDLCHALDSCEDGLGSASVRYFLALRKWYGGLRPEMEFRCFVRNKNLVGVTQREVTTFYPVLVEKRHDLCEKIEEFFEDVVLPRFESEDYTFDVYVTGEGKVKVVDFNPWGAYTLPLLFEWDELEGDDFGRSSKDEWGFEFRIVESQRAVRPGLKTAVPFDYLDTGEGSGWDQFLKRADEELRKQTISQEVDA